jgi:hypothetical protein
MVRRDRVEVDDELIEVDNRDSDTTELHFDQFGHNLTLVVTRRGLLDLIKNMDENAIQE